MGKGLTEYMYIQIKDEDSSWDDTGSTQVIYSLSDQEFIQDETVIKVDIDIKSHIQSFSSDNFNIRFYVVGFQDRDFIER